MHHRSTYSVITKPIPLHTTPKPIPLRTKPIALSTIVSRQTVVMKLFSAKPLDLLIVRLLPGLTLLLGMAL